MKGRREEGFHHWMKSLTSAIIVTHGTDIETVELRGGGMTVIMTGLEGSGPMYHVYCAGGTVWILIQRMPEGSTLVDNNPTEDIDIQRGRVINTTVDEIVTLITVSGDGVAVILHHLVGNLGVQLMRNMHTLREKIGVIMSDASQTGQKRNLPVIAL